MKLSDYIVDFLAKEGITHIFEVAGGSITHMLDSLYENKKIKTVSMHHEQAAAMAAEGYSRISGNFGVAMATSGPGATNLITGIGSCFFDSIPSLFITGQVNTYEFKFDRPVRQIGFQETDIVKIVKPIVKEATLIEEPEQIKCILERAIVKAKFGRPGPVLLDIPLNVQRANIREESLESCKSPPESLYNPTSEDIDLVIRAIKSAVRPIVLVGGGLRLSHAEEEFFQFVHKTKIPVVCSLMGLDAISHFDQLYIGMIGTYGNRYANLAIANSDLVIALGTRLDTRQTGTMPETFARAAHIIHVDIDPNELCNKIRPYLALNCDLKAFLVNLLSVLPEFESNKNLPWIKTINHYKNRYPSYHATVNDDIDPNFFIHELSEFVPENAVICTDIGQNQNWSAQSFELKGTQRFLTEGGMASMGSALPMAIGASFARPGETIVVLTGDGGFQLNIHELQTIYHHKLPIKIILFNNQCYGMIRQFQEQYFNCRHQSTGIGYSCPNFQEVVSAYKIPVKKIAKNSEIDGALRDIFNDKSQIFLEVKISESFKALPKLSVNKPVEDQDPALSRDEFNSNMIVKPYEN